MRELGMSISIFVMYINGYNIKHTYIMQVHHKLVLHGWVKIKWVQNVLNIKCCKLGHINILIYIY